MTQPKISVVMPVYNEQKYLDMSIQSILNQTFKDFEFIIVNDCSTDDSLQRIKSYGDERIKLIDLKKNEGHPHSKNFGLKIAKGKYVAILDGDDISHLQRLEKQFNYLEENPHIFLVGTSAIFIDEDGDEIRKFKKYNDYKMVAWRLLESCCIINSSVMFRNENRLYDDYFKGACDYDFYFKLLEDGKNLTNLPQFLTKYRLHKDSMSLYNEKEQKRLAYETQEKHNYLKDRINIFYDLLYKIRSVLFYLRNYKDRREK